jgi:Domain of unknown function (DUF4349)
MLLSLTKWHCSRIWFSMVFKTFRIYYSLTYFLRLHFSDCMNKRKTIAMKNTTSVLGISLLVIGLPLSIMFTACAGNAEKEDVSMKRKSEYSDGVSANMAYNTQTDSLSSSNVYEPMTVGKANDTNHVFMRNADMRFSVKDVRQACLDIEHLVRKHDGFVTYTSLSGNKYLNNSTRITKDSLLQEYKMTVTNEITMRIPNAHLDSTLIELNGMIEFIDTRTIRADDVKLQLLATSLKAKRSKEHINKLENTIASQGKKLKETSNALGSLDYSKNAYDEQQLSLMDLKDKVDYSTVKMYVYQPEVITYKKTLLPLVIEPYSPSFADRLSSALSLGWTILSAIILFFVSIWPMIVLFFVIVFITKWLVRSKVLSKLFKV